MTKRSHCEPSEIRRIKLQLILFPGPVHEAPFHQQKPQIEPVAQRASGEDRGIHPGHFEQLLRLEYAVTEAILRTDEHLGTLQSAYYGSSPPAQLARVNSNLVF